MVYLANVVRLLFSIYIILIFVRIILSWLKPDVFNPIIRFIYTLTDPYLKLFARIRFLRFGYLDLSPLLAFYVLYLLQELVYKTLLAGYFSFELLATLVVVLLFRFIFFIIFIFIVAVGLRFVFELVGLRTHNVLVSFVYSLSETAVRPLRNFFKLRSGSGFDFYVLAALVLLILLRFLILPRVLSLILMAMSYPAG
jgi:YggT family protein